MKMHNTMITVVPQLRYKLYHLMRQMTMTDQKIDRQTLPKEIQCVIALAEADGGTVSDFAIDLLIKEENGELSHEEAQEKIRQHYCGD